MATSDNKGNFLTKLARFVTNPTTDWSTLDSTMQTESQLGEDVPAMSQEEELRLRRERRKSAKRIREREFALLRKIRAGNYVEQAASFKTSLLDRSSSGKSVVSHHPHAPTGIFDVNQINSIEKQMADQWWSRQDAAPELTPETIAKTQIMIETRIPGADHDDARQGGMIPFDDALLYGQPASAEPQVPSSGGAGYGASRHAGAAERVNTELPASAEYSGSFNFDLAQAARSGQYVAADGRDSRLPESGLHAKADNAVPEGAAAPPLILEEALTSRLPPLKEEKTEVVPAAETPEAAPVPAEDEPQASVLTTLPDELNEPAILFAQGRDSDVEAMLQNLVEKYTPGPGASTGKGEPEIMLALLDFYRATRQEAQFEAAAVELVQQYGRSAPQYVSSSGSFMQSESSSMLPTTQFADDSTLTGHHWVAPALLDMTHILLLRSQLARDERHVLLDWRSMQAIDPGALRPLLDLLRELAGQKKELIMWGGQHLLEACIAQTAQAEGADRNLLWLTRLELVRIMLRQEDFDALALEYCLEFEESPPSWLRTRCKFVDADVDMGAQLLEEGNPPAAEAATEPVQEKGSPNLRHPLEWQGTIQGGQQELLAAVDGIAVGAMCMIDCSRLERMDYAACADVLAWLLARDPAAGLVRFTQVNRLLAVFWRIMGISTHAQVQVRTD